MTLNLRTVSFITLLFLPCTALANDEIDLVDADFEDSFDDFSEVRSSPTDSRKNRAKSPQDEDPMDILDEDPDWDVPEEPDAMLDEDPSWDAEPTIGATFDEPFEEEDDFVIPQAAPEPEVELASFEEDMVSVPETDDTHIQNATPGIDLSIFDIED